MLEDGLYTALTTTSAITALVGTRIYPVQGPPDQAVYPYIAYSSIAASSDYSFSNAETRSKRIQFDVFVNSLQGSTFGNGRAILKALRNALLALAGTTLSESTRVLDVERLNEIDRFDNDSKSIRSIAEYEFLISEPQ